MFSREQRSKDVYKRQDLRSETTKLTINRHKDNIKKITKELRIEKEKCSNKAKTKYLLLFEEYCARILHQYFCMIHQKILLQEFLCNFFLQKRIISPKIFFLLRSFFKK